MIFAKISYELILQRKFTESIIIYDNVCRRLVAGRWFSMGTPVPSTNKADRHDIIEILLKVALNTIALYKLWKLVEKNIYWTKRYQFTYLTNSTNEIIVHERFDLRWCRNSVRLQTGEICISMVTKKDNKSYCSFQKLYLYCYIFMNGVFYQNV